MGTTLNLQFESLSPIILSPRVQGALYKGIDFADNKAESKIKMVYPFYSYEDRMGNSDADFKKAESYYIPASSLKGALLGSKQNIDATEKEIRYRSLFQDIGIDKSQIERCSLYKFQYLYQNKINPSSIKEQYKVPKLEVFFPSVEFEMLKGGERFTGTVLLKGLLKENFTDSLTEIDKQTKMKLGNYKIEIQQRIEAIKGWELKDTAKNVALEKLREIEREIEKQIANKHQIIFLGGYKGILGSLSKEIFKNGKNDIQNGFYIDNCSKLPYGLAKINEG